MWEEIAVAIVSSFCGCVSGEAIGVNFSEDVAVYAYHYDLTGYDYSTNRYTNKVSSIARKVTTKKSDSYNEWFYDGPTPQTWKNSNDLAYWFWSDLFNYLQYPGVKSYS